MSSSDLHNAIEREDWDEARSLLSKFNARDFVEYKDSVKKNALHVACCSNVPSDVFQAMLDASETAPLQQDMHRRTPLHLAMMDSANIIIMKLIEACPRAASIGNNYGWTPLHWAIISNKPSIVIRHILAANPTAATTTNRYGDTPLRMFFRLWNVGLRNSMHSINGNENTIQDIILRNKMFGRRQENRIGELYETVLLLLQVASHGSIEGNQESPFRPLIAAIINPHCPWSFVNLILKFNPKQASQWDRELNLPIHVAAAASSSFDGVNHNCNGCSRKLENASWFHSEEGWRYCRNCFQEHVDDTRREEFNLMNSVDKIPAVIGDLLSTNPECAKIPNCEGRLPLYIAIQNEKSFEDGLQIIFRAALEALNTRDIVTHLYPFMLTGAKHDTKTKTLQKFTLCFSMLTENPVLVSSGIPKKRKRE